MAVFVSLDSFLRHGERNIDRGLTSVDVYPSSAETVDQSLATIIDRMVDDLPRDERIAVQLVVIARLSYRDAAVDMEMHCPDGSPDGKKVWRTVHRGLGTLRDRLRAAGWVEALAGHRLPEEEDAP